MSSARETRETRPAVGTFLLRLAVGAVFTAHGAQKLFAMGPAGVAGFFDSIGIPLAIVNAYAVIGIELLGGIALILGLGTRLLASLFAVIMAVAIATVHGAQGFFLPNGYEFTLTLLAASLTLALQGSGLFALDSLLRARPALRPELEGVRA